MKIILSRKGFDDENGGIPSLIWPGTNQMLSFPIPIREGSIEKGVTAESLSFNNYKVSQLLSDLGFRSNPENPPRFHLDPQIQNFAGGEATGLFGQSGPAQGHLSKCGISTGDIFLFFGTFCLAEISSGRLKLEPMHPFHAIWGYLQVDHVFDDLSLSLEFLRQGVESHPHYVNRGVGEYGLNNAIYSGEKYGTFCFREELRLTKTGYKKSYWSLPVDFDGVSITYHEGTERRIGDGRVEFKSVSKGQEFVIDNGDHSLDSWLRLVMGNEHAIVKESLV